MTRITALDVIDVRFPTSRELDGSDAMNPEPDYSAAYVVLRTDDPAVSGFSLLFTTGRGNEVACAAINALAPYLVGLERVRAGRRHRSVRARARVGRSAALARAGEGRHAHGDRGGRERAVGPPVAPRRAPALAAVGVAHAGGGRRPDRLHLHRRRTVSGRGAVHPAGAAHGTSTSASTPSSATASRPTPHLPAGSATTTPRSIGSRGKRSNDGFTMIKLKVGADVHSDMRRLQVARAAVGTLGPRGRGREPTVGSGPGDRVDEAPRRVRAVLDRGTDVTRRRARASDDSPRGAARSASRRASTSRTGSSSSSCFRLRRSTSCRSTRAVSGE